MQQPAGGFIQLAFHQRGHQMHDRDRHAAPLQAPGGFQPQQAAADDHGALIGSGSIDHRVHIADIAEGADTGQVEAGDGRDDGLGPSGDQ